MRAAPRGPPTGATDTPALSVTTCEGVGRGSDSRVASTRATAQRGQRAGNLRRPPAHLEAASTLCLPRLPGLEGGGVEEGAVHEVVLQDLQRAQRGQGRDELEEEVCAARRERVSPVAK